MPDNLVAGQHGFWEFKKYKEHEWFRFLVYLLGSIVLIYVVTHVFARDDAKYEYQRLDKEQLQQINRIYFDSVNRIEDGSAINKTNSDQITAEDSTLEQVPDLGEAHQEKSLTDATDSLMIYKTDRVINYIRNQFSDKLDPTQIRLIRPYLNSALPLEALGFLGTLRLRVRSYFWLTGPEVYFEIIFWSLFGVLASIIFNLGVISRNSTTNPSNPQTVFDSSEIPYQFGKLLYAPLCTLIIVLGYNFFSEQNIADISSSKGVIVFAFIGGFYSARLIAFLDRLKEILLPNSSTSDLPVVRGAETVLLQNVTVDLQLDDESISPDLRNEITEIGLADSTVVFINEATAEEIKALKKEGDQSSTFVVPNLKPAKYRIQASWSKDVDSEPINLLSEQTELVMNADKTIVVTLKKANEEG